ncbi:hypothetical protein WG66_011657 [Moniliophthora roreri]|nr:hypothetical protein WG66_011657 [Moniliophthora roreri]
MQRSGRVYCPKIQVLEGVWDEHYQPLRLAKKFISQDVLIGRFELIREKCHGTAREDIIQTHSFYGHLSQ